jgi:hypothetical protein
VSAICSLKRCEEGELAQPVVPRSLWYPASRLRERKRAFGDVRGSAVDASDGCERLGGLGADADDPAVGGGTPTGEVDVVSIPSRDAEGRVITDGDVALPVVFCISAP